jgi:Protein of unknown function (DUF3347)
MKLQLIMALSLISFSGTAKSVVFKFNCGAVYYIDSSSHSSLSNLLPLYYDLKNALVNDDAASASKKAEALLNAINRVDLKTLSGKEHDIFVSLKDKLSYDTRHIAEVQKIDHQREHFASLSLNMYTLAKSAKLTSQPVYEDYCPMKKAYWLSEEAIIKNPYFGTQMPTCGKVTNTLN